MSVSTAGSSFFWGFFLSAGNSKIIQCYKMSKGLKDLEVNHAQNT